MRTLSFFVSLFVPNTPNPQVLKVCLNYKISAYNYNIIYFQELLSRTKILLYVFWCYLAQLMNDYARLKSANMFTRIPYKNKRLCTVADFARNEI